MALFTAQERSPVSTAATLAYTNPFVAERTEMEQGLIGDEYVATPGGWSMNVQRPDDAPNVPKLHARVRGLADAARQRLLGGLAATPEELDTYERLVLFVLYHNVWEDLNTSVQDHLTRKAGRTRAPSYDRFVEDAMHYLALPGPAGELPSRSSLPHVFACFFQIRRAFHHIFTYIIGRSSHATRLRAAIWESVFTHDLGRYRRSLYNRMGEVTTLIIGPSGTGKELVARAIGLSRYIPFDPRTRSFTEDFSDLFHALNLSAMSPTLIESELFGHKRGSFTGAIADRVGWLELCRPLGTVFLDEIGDLDPAIQVKLLRVLTARTFQRIGDVQERTFAGKIIAATNRDLAKAIREGHFRTDFYYRLCSDVVVTPSLREQLADSPDDLQSLVLFVTRRIAGDEADELTREVVKWVRANLGDDYAWPGNVRELEQCVRNVMIRHDYRPAALGTTADDPRRALAEAVAGGSLSADELLRRYCTLIYAQTGSYEESARRTGLDRRTIKAKIDGEMLAALRSGK